MRAKCTTVIISSISHGGMRERVCIEHMRDQYFLLHLRSNSGFDDMAWEVNVADLNNIQWA